MLLPRELPTARRRITDKLPNDLMVAASAYILKVPPDRRSIILSGAEELSYFPKAAVAEPVPTFAHSRNAPLVVTPDDKGLFKGIYVPLDLWKVLDARGRLKGPKGGNVLSYENVGRRLNNSGFVMLVANSWVGTTIGQSAALERVIRSVLESGKTVTFAVKRKVAPPEAEAT